MRKQQSKHLSYSARNNRHFQQNFEDSQLNSVRSYNPLIQDNSIGRAVQLIRIRPYGKIEIDQDALDIIAQSSLPVGFCCIAGKYRTGKSFLLNKLLKLEGDGFRVDPSTNACTEGIWMWTKPLLNQRQGNYIYFIDTQGTASMSKDSNNDAKVFTLANLISSYLIYNSVGSIDQKSISQLNLVSQLAKNITIQDYTNLTNNQENLYRYMPKFLWLLRDFTLQPTDKNGRKMTAQQYLQDALFQQNAAVKVNQNTKKIRRNLTKYYKDRDCMTLVRPAYQQRDLQNLNRLPEHALRKDFIHGVNVLRQKILKNTGPKTFQENALYGSQVASMIQSYVNTMNNGGIPSIRTAWEQINQDQGAVAFDVAIEKFNYLIQKNFDDERPKGEQIHSLLRQINDQVVSQYYRKVTQPNQTYELKLKQYIREKQQKIIDINKQLIYNNNIVILRQVTDPIINKISANSYDNNPELLNVQLEQASQIYNQRAKGQGKGQILSQFLTHINPIVISIAKKNADIQRVNAQQIVDRNNQIYQKQLRLKNEQLKSAQMQLKSKQQVQEHIVKARTPPPRPIAKKDTKGCCGARDKCLIM